MRTPFALLFIALLLPLAAHGQRLPGGAGGRDYLSLHDYNLPTGGDDTAAINSVLSTAASKGLAVYAPAGTYKHAGVITDNGVCLFGDGASTIFQSTDTTNPNPNLTIELTGTGPCLKNLQVTSTWSGARQSNGESQAVWVTGATNYKVENIVINGGAAGGIFQTTSSNGIVAYNQINNTLADAIGVYTNSYNVSEIGNAIVHPGDDCMSVIGANNETTGPYNVRLVGNSCLNGQARGIAIVGGNRVTASANTIDTATASCFYVAAESGYFAPYDVVFHANMCNASDIPASGVPGAALVFGNTGYVVRNVAFIGNDFTNLANHCADFGTGNPAADTVNVQFIGNLCGGNGATGVGNEAVILDGVTNVTVDRNVFYNWGGNGIDPGAGKDAGYAEIAGNTFDKIGASTSGGWAIYLPSEGFSAVLIRNNREFTDGSANVNGLITLSGVTKGVIDGNVGDNAANSISGFTSGRYSNP